MLLETKFVNLEHNAQMEQFIDSLVSKTFPKSENIESINVLIKVINNPQVPWTCTISLKGEENRELEVQSSASNYLTAFSQALMRIRRQWDKSNNELAA